MEHEMMLVLGLYEEKLKTYMTEEEYNKFTSYVAKQVLKVTVNGIEDSDLKAYCFRELDRIVEDIIR